MERPAGELIEMEPKLMVSAFVCLEKNCGLSSEIKRGMSILSQAGIELGKVAAVMLDSKNRTATHILLSRLPQTSGYWMVSIDLISRVQYEKLWLNIPEESVYKLPLWHPRQR